MREVEERGRGREDKEVTVVIEWVNKDTDSLTTIWFSSSLPIAFWVTTYPNANKDTMVRDKDIAPLLTWVFSKGLSRRVHRSVYRELLVQFGFNQIE